MHYACLPGQGGKHSAMRVQQQAGADACTEGHPPQPRACPATDPGTPVPCCVRLAADMVVRQQHLANGSVQLAVDALLMPPPAGQGGAGAEEQGELVLELASPDGSQHWRAQAPVTIPPPVPCPADGGGSDSSGAAESSPWLQPEGCQAGDQVEGGPRLAPHPVKRGVGVLVEAPQLWWPHDFGEQPLYRLQLTYTPVAASNSQAAGDGAGGRSSGALAAEAGEEEPATDAAAAEAGARAPGGPGVNAGLGTRSSKLSRRIGFRTVELVTDPLPGGAAETFYFRINGQPVFARGEPRALLLLLWTPTARPARPFSSVLSGVCAAHCCFGGVCAAVSAAAVAL